MAGSSPAMTKVDAAGAQSPLDTPAPRFVNRASGHACGGRAHSSAGERSLHTGEVQGSIPCAPTITFNEINGHGADIVAPQSLPVLNRAVIKPADAARTCRLRQCWQGTD